MRGDRLYQQIHQKRTRALIIWCRCSCKDYVPSNDIVLLSAQDYVNIPITNNTTTTTTTSPSPPPAPSPSLPTPTPSTTPLPKYHYHNQYHQHYHAHHSNPHHHPQSPICHNHVHPPHRQHDIATTNAEPTIPLPPRELPKNIVIDQNNPKQEPPSALAVASPRPSSPRGSKTRTVLGVAPAQEPSQRPRCCALRLRRPRHCHQHDYGYDHDYDYDYDHLHPRRGGFVRNDRSSLPPDQSPPLLLLLRLQYGAVYR